MSAFEKGDVLAANAPVQQVGVQTAAEGGAAATAGAAAAGARRDSYREFMALSERYPEHSARDIYAMYRERELNEAAQALSSARDAADEFRYNGHDPDDGLLGSSMLRQRYGNLGAASSPPSALGSLMEHRTVQDYFASNLSAISEVTALLTQEQLRTLKSLPGELLALIIDNAARARRERRARRAAPNECSFCKNNGEVETYYKGHMLKDRAGRVLCPVLRSYSCPRCQATGDDAHTIKYCPLGSALDGDRHFTPISVLKATERMASGARRRGPLSLHLPPAPAPAPASPNQLSPTAAAWSPFAHQY